MYIIKKIKAFTLIELLVAIAITAIVVGLAFSVLLIVKGNIGNIQKNFESTTSRQLAVQQLFIDLKKYPTSNLDRNNIRFASPMDSIIYTLYDNIVLREEDTVFTERMGLDYYFMGEEVKSGSFDAMRLNFYIDGDTSSVFVSKLNDSKSIAQHGD